jgi:hypothetical protein
VKIKATSAESRRLTGRVHVLPQDELQDGYFALNNKNACD